MKDTPARLRIPALLAFIFVSAAACDPPGGSTPEAPRQAAFASLIVESDSLACGRSEVIHKNRSTDTLKFHLKVRDSCLDTLPELGVSRVIVEDSAGVALTVDTIVGHTFRGTLVVPPGRRIKLECLRTTGLIPGQCVWEYKYNLP